MGHGRGHGRRCGAQEQPHHALQYALGGGAITCAMGCCKRNDERKRIGEGFIIKGKIDGSAIWCGKSQCPD